MQQETPGHGSVTTMDQVPETLQRRIRRSKKRLKEQESEIRTVTARNHTTAVNTATLDLRIAARATRRDWTVTPQGVRYHILSDTGMESQDSGLGYAEIEIKEHPVLQQTASLAKATLVKAQGNLIQPSNWHPATRLAPASLGPSLGLAITRLPPSNPTRGHKMVINWYRGAAFHEGRGVTRAWCRNQ